MVFNVWCVIVGSLLVLMALVSTVLRRLPLTTSILYLGLGMALGPWGVGLIRFDALEHSAAMERLTELAVVISLFTAGLKMRIPFRDRRWWPPARLATLTMVLTIAAVTALGVYLLRLPLGAAVLLGAVLAPTDPVLASDVQVEHATDRDRLRFSLTGEAGLNDGTAFPFVMLGLGLLGFHELGPSGARWFAVDLLWAAVAGLAIGWILGQVIGRVTLHLRAHHEHAVGYEDFLTLGLVALGYGVALLCHAYGFLAVFAAGLSLRHVEMGKTGSERDPHQVIEDAPGTHAEDLSVSPEAGPAYMAHAVLGFSEQMERILEVTVVLILGALVGQADWSLEVLAFVGLMLLLVRPAAVALTYHGAGTLGVHRPYVAWFGIRGIGSLYYLFYAMQHGVSGPLARELMGITLAVVAVSIVVHGVTVTPLMRRYRESKPGKPRVSASLGEAQAEVR
jgi:NhaP-type Na+/H+ or K+/H+ antiporter